MKKRFCMGILIGALLMARFLPASADAEIPLEATEDNELTYVLEEYESDVIESETVDELALPAVEDEFPEVASDPAEELLPDEADSEAEPGYVEIAEEELVGASPVSDYWGLGMADDHPENRHLDWLVYSGGSWVAGYNAKLPDYVYFQHILEYEDGTQESLLAWMTSLKTDNAAVVSVKKGKETREEGQTTIEHDAWMYQCESTGTATLTADIEDEKGNTTSVTVSVTVSGEIYHLYLDTETVTTDPGNTLPVQGTFSYEKRLSDGDYTDVIPSDMTFTWSASSPLGVISGETSASSGSALCLTADVTLAEGNAMEQEVTVTLTAYRAGTAVASASCLFVLNEEETHDHQPDQGTVTRKPTVFREGEGVVYCQECGELLDTYTIPKLKPTVKLSASGTITLKPAASKKVTVSGMARGDSFKKVTSSKPSIVTAKKSGNTITLKALKKAGTSTIKVTLASGKTVSFKVKVPTVKTTKLTIKSKTISVKKGRTVTLKPAVTPSNSTQAVTYTTSNKKVATVTSKGVVKGIKKGQARITVKSGSKKVVVTVKVK